MRIARIAVLGLLVIGLSGFNGCASWLPKTPAQTVYAAKAGYSAALDIAIAYRKLPPCGAGAPIACSKPEVVAFVQAADKVAFAALEHAENAVRNPAFGESVLKAAAISAREAVAAFIDVTQTLPSKGGS